MWRVLVVEDSPAAAAQLEGHLARFGEERGEAFSVQVLGSALEFLSGHHEADLVFLDIDLPGINGMEAAGLWRVGHESTPMIFVTNLAQYAMQGYSVSALDFVLKPVSYRDFEPRMARALRLMQRNAVSTLTLSVDGETHVVDLHEVVYVEVTRHTLNWHLAGTPGVALRSRGTMKALADELAPRGFCRVSASHLVNMGQVTRLGAGSVTMSDGCELTFSRTYKKSASEALARYVGQGA